MPLNLVSNFAANVSQRNLQNAQEATTSSLTKLSAGRRVTAAKDDAASLAIGSRLGADVAALRQAAVNAGQAISMLQIADGAMAKVNDVLTRMKSLSVQAASGSLSDSERGMLNTEYIALRSEVDRIANDTDFAGTRLVNGELQILTFAAPNFGVDDGILDIKFHGDFDAYTNAAISYDHTVGAFSVTVGTETFNGTMSSDSHNGTWMVEDTLVTLSSTSSTNKIDIHVGASFWMGFAHAAGILDFATNNSRDFTFKIGTGALDPTADDVTISLNNLSSDALGVATTNLVSEASSDAASVAVSTAIDNLQTYRASIGGDLNRIEFAAANIATATENSEAARSRLLDLNIATEMSSFVSNMILLQSGTSMLAQANNLPKNLLRLFN